MADAGTPLAETSVVDTHRRTAVLHSALLTFARYGYRKTSMDQVAREANISRPGLYFLFTSKQMLFREAVELSVREDLAAVERALGGSENSFRQRLVQAFDHWAGKYVGPLTRDVAGVVDGNPDVLGPVVMASPERFAELITRAVVQHQGGESAALVAQTLISTSIGVVHQVNERSSYLQRISVAVDLLVATPSPTLGRSSAAVG